MVKRKKKTLPSLSKINPTQEFVLPDQASGIDSFNNMSSGSDGCATAMGESLKDSDINKFKQEIVDATREFMIKRGYDEEEALDYMVFDFSEEPDRYKMEIRGEFGYSTLDKLANVLNKIVAKYDEDAYFDHEDYGIINTYLEKGNGVRESLKRLNNNNFECFGEDLCLEEMYTMLESDLTSQEKSELTNFVRKSKDAKEIDTYLKGLMAEKEDKESEKK